MAKSENGHCFALVKLAYLGLARATGFDFRLIAFSSTLLLVAAALATVAVIARRRGRASALDLLAPVLLLNWGHYVNILWGFQLGFTMPTALACGLLLMMTADRRQLSLAGAAAAGLLAIAAALCGGPGIFYLPAAAAWLAYAGVEQLARQSCGERRHSRRGRRHARPFEILARDPARAVRGPAGQ